MSETQASSIEEIIDLSQRINYFLQLRLAASTHETSLSIPPETEQILELARNLPKPGTTDWSALALGKLPKKRSKPKRGGEGSSSSRQKWHWSEESKEEMVKLVDDASLREEVLGKDGTRNGIVNWALLANRYGYSTSDPLRKLYRQLTGKEAPGSRAKRGSTSLNQPASKKAKSSANSHGWTSEQSKELIRLVEDESYRKKKTGKSKLKWSKILLYLGKESKRDCKRRYTQITGKILE